MENIASKDRYEMKEFLSSKGVCDQVAENFYINEVGGEAFLKLTEEDLKELVPLVGTRTKVRSILEEALKENKSVHSTSVPCAVPERATDPVSPYANSPDGWHEVFEIPRLAAFSATVQQAIETGVIVAKARQEIVQMLRTLMVQHTKYPTPEQYTRVCHKLITKYPKLRDTIGSNGYGSWKQSLRNSFKNFRRDIASASSSASPIQTNSRKRKRVLDSEEELPASDEYEQKATELRTEWKKGRKNRNQRTIKSLMDDTREARHKWIVHSRPLISDVLRKFPSLKDSKVLRREFCALACVENVKELTSDWTHWSSKLAELAKLEAKSRPVLQSLLSQLDEDCTSMFSERDYKDSLIIEILMKLLYPRGFAKDAYIVKRFLTCDVALSEDLEKIKQTEPFIVVAGSIGEENCQYHICAENGLSTKSKSFRDAIVDLIGAYYVYDIKYPSAICGIFLFIQQTVFKIMDSQKQPSCLVKLLKNFDTVSV